MIQSITSQGLVLYNRNFREDDKLVKIFTEQAGKRMFFVKHAGQSKLAPVIQPLVLARFLLRINDDGLSYIEDYHEVMTFPKINSDLFVMAYATYVAALADATGQSAGCSLVCFFAKDFGVDGRGFGLSGFDQYF